jgi:hypothetical protein
MRGFGVALIIAASVLVFVERPAYAHVLKTSGTPGTILHVTPGGNPVAGAPATLHFNMKDTHGTFSFGERICRVGIIREQRVLASALLAGPELHMNFRNAGYIR